MLRSFIVAAAIILCAGQAHAQQIKVTGFGEATAEASRAVLTVPLTLDADAPDTGPLAGVVTTAVLERADAIARIRRADRSAREAPAESEAVGPMRFYLSLSRRAGMEGEPLRYEVAVSAFDRLEEALDGALHAYEGDRRRPSGVASARLGRCYRGCAQLTSVLWTRTPDQSHPRPSRAVAFESVQITFNAAR